MTLLGLLVLSAAAGGAPQTAAACSCADLSPEVAFKQADEVFQGVVEQFRWVTEPAIPQATFRVTQVWKGSRESSRRVLTFGDCSVPFIGEGDGYLVYAKDGYTDTCMRTRAFKDAIEDRAALGSGTPIVSEVPKANADAPDADTRVDAPLNLSGTECRQQPEFIPVGSIMKKWISQGPQEDPWKNAHEVESFMFERCIKRPAAYRHCEHIVRMALTYGGSSVPKECRYEGSSPDGVP